MCQQYRSTDEFKSINFGIMTLSRRDFIMRTGILGSALTFLPFSRLLASDASNFTSIRRNVGIYTNRGGTVGWMVNNDASIVVDSQYPDSAVACLNGIRKKRDATIDALINTHHHGDHTGGNLIFKPQVKKIMAHKNVPKLQLQQLEMRGEAPHDGIANATYSDEWREDFGDETVHLKYYGPAHTSGDTVVTFEKANVVHMGDLMFNKVYPFIDKPGGASVQNWIQLLTNVVSDHDTDTIYIFGHGQPDLGMTGGLTDLMHMRSYLQALTDHVNDGIQKGLAREEIVGIATLKGFEDRISFGPRLSLAANLEVTFEELSST